MKKGRVMAGVCGEEAGTGQKGWGSVRGTVCVNCVGWGEDVWWKWEGGWGVVCVWGMVCWARGEGSSSCEMMRVI